MCRTLKTINQTLPQQCKTDTGNIMKPRIAVLGCGHWGRNLVRNFNRLGYLEMVCDPAETARAMGTQIAPGIAISERFEDAIASSQVDAIAIAAPASMHYSLTKAALEG